MWEEVKKYSFGSEASRLDVQFGIKKRKVFCANFLQRESENHEG